MVGIAMSLHILYVYIIYTYNICNDIASMLVYSIYYILYIV